MEKEIAETEIKYRVSKWIVSNLVVNNMISEGEASECIKKLLAKYEPPTLCFEEVTHEEDNQN